MGNNIIKLLLTLIVGLVAGCSNGNRIITNREGEVSETVYISPDSIPGSYKPDKYLLGYGDMLDISLLYNQSYSKNNVRVRPDGYISFPYVGEINVSGMTVDELDDLLTERFSEIIKRPDVSIIIREFRPMNVYVLGEVEMPGAYQTQEVGNVLEALSAARGITEAARRNGVLVIRKTGPEHIVGIQIDLNKIVKESRFDYNIQLEPNDIVLVPQSRISRLENFINSYLSVLKEPFELLRTYYYIRQAEATYEHFVVRGGE
ncbi:MAG: polysaccharide biosynthesis/export family protein [Candidatus Krumholzibacteriales bacterium]